MKRYSKADVIVFYIRNYEKYSITSDFFLKFLINKYFMVGNILFTRNSYGKVRLLYPRIEHSISKTKNYLFITFSSSEVGIDIEEFSSLSIHLDYLIGVLPESIRVKKTLFQNTYDYKKYYFERWCQVESMYKLIGTGLTSFPCYSLDDLKSKEFYKMNNEKYSFYYPDISKNLICCICSKVKDAKIAIKEIDKKVLEDEICMNKYEIKDLNFSKIEEIEEGNIFERAKIAYDYLKYEYDKENLFTRRISLTGSSPEVEILDIYTNKKKKMIYFASNDYLNLTKHPKTIEAGISAIKKYGSGSGSVPILGGTTDLHIELENKIAKFKGCEASIAYSSGFGSNCGTLLSLLKKNDLAILDMYVHASIVDGCKNTNVEYFLHNDMKHLEKILKRSQNKYNTVLVIVDGVYSMDGDIAPLDKIVELAKKYGALVMVDEAHATGVIGKNGKGTPEYFNLEGQIDIVAGTFSKGIGSVGGFIASSKELVEMIRYYSRPYMFSTAITPQASASIIAALDIIQEDKELRNKLWDNIIYLKEKLLNLGFNLGNSQTAIFPIIIGDDEKTKAVCRYLHKNGVYVNLVLYPAVPKELSRIRISVMANHTKDHLDRLVNLLEKIGKELEII